MGVKVTKDVTRKSAQTLAGSMVRKLRLMGSKGVTASFDK